MKKRFNVLRPRTIVLVAISLSFLIVISAVMALPLQLTIFSVAQSPRSSASDSASSPTWSIVNSPNPTPNNGVFLTSVSASSVSNVWAVGYFYNNSDHTLAEHWNGNSWSIVPTSSAGINGGYFDGVSAVSSNDVWAVGERNTNVANGYRTLIEHFNGNSWLVVPSPNPPSNRGDFLNGVTAISPSDAWAVGNYRNITDVNGYPEQKIFSLVLHWNGASWKQFTGDGLPPGGDLLSIISFSASDVWINDGFQALHYNGTDWSVTPPFPLVDGGSPNVFSIGGASSDDLWGVGSYFAPPPKPGYPSEELTFAAHWNGTSWSQVATPSPSKVDTPAPNNELLSVAAVKSNDVWAVGLAVTKNDQAVHTLIEHWDGKSWSIVASPNPPSTSDDELQGVAVSGPATLWAVGFAGSDSGVYSTLILRTVNG